MNKKEFDDIISLVDPLTARSIQAAKEKGASAWLTALPIKKLGYVLNKQEFRNALWLRYKWYISDIPRFCGCGERNDIIHVLNCKKGGYVSLRHNSLRDAIANIMRGVCTDVCTEPSLLPTDPNNFATGTNTADEARLDISARGIHSAFERTFYDIRVAHPFAASNVDMPLQKVYQKHEQEKIRTYQERVKEVEKGSFEPLVFLTTGGTGPRCTKVIQRLAEMVSSKRQEKYSDVIGFIRTKLRFSLLRSVLIAIRGERGKRSNFEPNLRNVAFNTIPTMEEYEA